MIVTDNRRELIGHLRAADAPVIAVDGWHGAGKSWLGRTIGCLTGREWIDLDSLLDRDPEEKGFMERLDLGALEAGLTKGPVVLSGVCMREALSRIQHPATVHVYVKEVLRWQGWYEENEANGLPCPIDEVCPPSLLRLEVRAYHAKWRPHEQADYVLERKDYPPLPC